MREKITVSNRHLPLRIVGFVLALAVAVGAFSFGISRIGHHDPGYDLVETNPDEEAPGYFGGVTFRYYYEGSSAEIREQRNQLRDAYSTVLLRAYKLLDPVANYEGYVNLASLNRSDGLPCEVSDELYAILREAYALTMEAAGYNLFAGALSAEWDSILYLSDPLEFDPAENEESAARLARLAEETAKLEHFTLEFLDDEAHVVRFAVDAEYAALLRELEIDAPVLDLNRLREAFALRLAAEVLEGQGWRNGYLCTDGGLTVSLSAHENGEFCLYGLRDGVPVEAAAIPVTGGVTCSQLRTAASVADEPGYYALPDGTSRHPNYALSGAMPQLLSTSYVIDRDCVAAAYRNLQLMAAQSLTEAAEIADCDAQVVYLPRGEAVFRANATALLALALNAGAGYAVKPIG